MLPTNERRGSGTLRVPFVRVGAVRLDGAREVSAFIVNINVLGAYVAWDAAVAVGQRVNLRFGTPGSALEVSSPGVVAWLNTRQQHPVHSLPIGMGVRFVDLPDQTRLRIEKIVDDYVRRHPQAGVRSGG